MGGSCGGLPVGGSLWGPLCGGLSGAPHQAKAQAKAANLFTVQHEAGGHTHSARPLPSAMAISSWTRNLCPLGKAKLASSSAHDYTRLQGVKAMGVKMGVMNCGFTPMLH